MYRFMYGRYGADNLYSFLMVLFFIIWIAELVAIVVIPEGIARSIVSTVLSVTVTAIIVWAVFRTMSRNISKRRKENEIYLKCSRAAKRFFTFNTSRGTKSRNADSNMYIFRDCTKCGSVLRLPRRAGKHKVKCPRCSHNFYVKAKKLK